jgi:hypothetical protein
MQNTLSKIMGYFAGSALILFGGLWMNTAQAAPMPGTSTSKLVAPQLGIYRSPHGFQISAGESGWTHGKAPAGNKFIATVYHAPKNQKDEQKNTKSSASLTVRVDKLEKEMPLEKYVQKWKKEYPKYGFDVLTSRSFTENKQKGYYIDLVNRDSGKKLRQVVFLKNQRAAIITCRDKASSFKETLKGCNQITRTFQWTE